MNLRDLEYIIAVAKFKNFGEAAKHCLVSQPTLSMQVKKLEDFLDVKIFERTNKKVLITLEGSQILDKAREVLLASQEIVKMAKSFQDPFSGQVSLGAFPTLASYVLPSIVTKISDKFPKIDLLLVEEKTDVLIKKLEVGELDLALLAMPSKHSNLIESHFILKDDFYLAINSKHLLASKKRVDVSVLQEVDLLLLDEGHCLRDQALEVCSLVGAPERTDFRATSMETLKQMVVCNNFGTLVPKLAISKNDKDLVYIPFKNNSPYRNIGLFFRKNSFRNSLYIQWAKLIQDWLK